MDREHQVFGFPYPPMADRFEMLEEALAYARAMLSDDPIGFDGDHYTLEAFPIAPKPNGHVKLLVGGIGATKTPRLAGAYADEFNVYPGPDLEIRIDRARAASSAAGRDPDALMLSSAGQVVGAATEAELEQRLDALAEESNMTRDELATLFAKRDTPIGTYGQLREQFAVLEGLGISRFYLQGGYDPDRTPELVESVTA
jgi:alkanesulfonate monooxygenase SsuD/methylene tetrahydromethanopterin reductase-like flavin-dependent oxidoreductase (luciferase family)